MPKKSAKYTSMLVGGGGGGGLWSCIKLVFNIITYETRNKEFYETTMSTLFKTALCVCTGGPSWNLDHHFTWCLLLSCLKLGLGDIPVLRYYCDKYVNNNNKRGIFHWDCSGTTELGMQYLFSHFI